VNRVFGEERGGEKGGGLRGEEGVWYNGRTFMWIWQDTSILPVVPPRQNPREYRLATAGRLKANTAESVTY